MRVATSACCAVGILFALELEVAMKNHARQSIYSAFGRGALGLALIAMMSLSGGQAHAISNTLSVFFTDGVPGQWSVDGGMTWRAPDAYVQYPYAPIPFQVSISFRDVFGYYTPAVTTVTFTADSENLQPIVTYVPWSST